MNQFEIGLTRYFTEVQLSKIRQASIGIAGAGGLGSNCAILLARCGFRQMTIVDFDRVSASNLNRQSYYAGQIGQSKVAALAENLGKINPAVNVQAISAKIDRTNAQTLFRSCAILVEALDRPEDKTLFIETFADATKFLVAASGIAGFGHSDRIRVHQIRENFYVVGDLTSSVEQMPPLAPCVTIAAAKQADLVLRHVLEG